MRKQPVSLIVVGAGCRGKCFADLAKKIPDRATIVGVAEPRTEYRDSIALEHDLLQTHVCTDWRELAAQPKFADAVIITTLDRMHAEPTVAFAEKGYHVLLEKPMAPTEAECRRIVESVQDNNVIFAVGHVMRYTDYTRQFKQVLDSGIIGEPVCIQHIEAVCHWHFAHAFVRGNWANEKESSSVLLQKCCHDLDWIRYLLGKPCRKVSSFGSLYHFHKDNMPDGAAERCVDCNAEPTCPYSALRIYLGFLEKGTTGWPVDIITTDVTETGIMSALRNGPYGRCVYQCDNDVLDNQVVNMEFEGGLTATHTVTAFANDGRRTRIFGTHGSLEGNTETGAIEHRDWLTDKTQTLDPVQAGNTIASSHGGGDYGVFGAFVKAVASGDTSSILSGPLETLETHLMVFAAEQSRHENRVVEVKV